MEPYYDEGGIVIYHADCRDLLAKGEDADLLLTDPPYPNNAGHFDGDVAAAKEVLGVAHFPRSLVFWHRLERPPSPNPLVAHHIWHRTNTNRPDNYEPIYEFAADGQERASRVFPFAVVHPGLTGCREATGHPTQKNLKLIEALIRLRPCDSMFDPFMGSGTTLEAAKLLGRKAIGVEVNERYCEIAAKRLAQGVLDVAGAA